MQRLLRRQQRRARTWLALLVLGLLVASLLSLSCGAFGISLQDWWQGLDPLQQQVVWELRLPRTLLAILVGAGLATCGAVLQTLLHNPVAEPGLIGISSGASLAAVGAIFAAQHLELWLPAWGISYNFV